MQYSPASSRPEILAPRTENFGFDAHKHLSPTTVADLDDTTASASLPNSYILARYRQHAWCLRQGCPSGQVHQRLRRFLEASGKASHPRFVKPKQDIEKYRHTRQPYHMEKKAKAFLLL